MPTVIFYTKDICSLCDDAEALVSMFQHEYEFELEERDIYSNDEWLEQYQLLIPVVEVNGEQITCEEMGYDALEKLFKKHFGSK